MSTTDHLTAALAALAALASAPKGSLFTVAPHLDGLAVACPDGEDDAFPMNQEEMHAALDALKAAGFREALMDRTDAARPSEVTGYWQLWIPPVAVAFANLTAESIMEFAAGEAESAYRDLREYIDAESENLRYDARRGSIANRTPPADVVAAHAARLAEVERLKGVKYRLAILAGRYDDRLPTDASAADVVARRRAMLAGEV